MSTTKTAVPHTKNGETFSPVTKHMNHHGKEPEAPAPETIEDLEHELAGLSSDLLEASGVLSVLAEGASREGVCSFLWCLEGLADRAHTRLDEAADALHSGHTENIGHRMEDVGTMALHAKSAMRLAWETDETAETPEMRAGAFAVATNALTYVQERLDHLVYEAELPFD